MHKLIASGNLGKDAEIKEAMATHKQFITFPIAVSEKISGNETTTWYWCFIHNENIVKSTLINYLKKGTKVLIMGRPSAEVWNKPDGTNVVSASITVHNIELMGSVSGHHQRPEDMQAANKSGSKPEPAKEESGNKTDDDLPF